MWVPEYSETYAWFSKHLEDGVERVAELNFDMVGENVKTTNALFAVSYLPDWNPSFLNPLVESVVDFINRYSDDRYRRYVGVTADLPARLTAHNAGQNPSTAPWRPWRLDVCVEFRTERIAVRFEKYLKSGAGHAFAKRYFEDEG